MTGRIDWDRLEELFDRARSIPAQELRAWIDEQTAGDAVLKTELESLLLSRDVAPEFIAELSDRLVGRGARGLVQDTESSVTQGDDESLLEQALGPVAEDDDRLTAALRDRYVIERRLGEGGMAHVFLARDLKHERHVALKLLRPEIAVVMGGDRFLQEIRTTANLQHPHILPLFDSGRVRVAADASRPAGEFLYYVMPFIDGESLRDKLNRETQLDIGEAVRITTAIADALDYAHRHDVIHRDIKPENILLQDGHPVVADFGIALAISAAAGGRMTETGLSLGTPHYMSPEQATAEREITHRSDIYSLGSVLYEMLSGEPPHTGSSAQTIILKIVSDDVKPVTHIRKAVPPHVAGSVSKSLEKLPADRFPSASEFGRALNDESFRYQEDGKPGSGSPGSQWNSLARITTGIAAMAVVGLTWTLLTPRDEPDSVQRFAIALGPEEGLVPAWRNSLAMSPDGRRVVYVGQGDSTTKALWLKDVSQLRPRRIEGTERANSPFFSPDGSRVGFIDDGGALHIVTLSSGQRITLADGLGLSSSASWGGDGFIYARQAVPYVLVRISEDSGEQQIISTLGEEEFVHAGPVVLPNGELVVFSIMGPVAVPDPSVAVLDLETGVHRKLIPGVRPLYAETGHIVYSRPDGVLAAAPFDPDIGELTGPSVRLDARLAIDQTVNQGGVDVAMSQTGDLVYIGALAEEANRVAWLDDAGGIVPVEREWPGTIEGLRLSPDGRSIVASIVAESTSLWITDLTSRAAPQPFATSAGLNRRPEWTPDGNSVVFVSDRDGGRDVYIKGIRGRDAEKLLDLDVDVDEAFLTPAGWLIYRTGTTFGDRDIFARGPNSDSSIVIAAEPGIDEYSPVLSSNGRWLAYISDATGNDNVWVRPFPDAATGRWRVSADVQSAAPQWSPDGRRLFYTSDFQLMAASLEFEPSFRVVDTAALFTLDGIALSDLRTSYDIAPDGRFLVIHNPARTELVVVQNFFEELRQRVPR